MALCTVQANCSMQMSLLVYLAVVVGVSSVVLWWNEAKHLVYMALVDSLVEAGTACLHGSCRQFCFGPVVLWWV
eukprot:scaffold35942_cov400-Skeletonema_dohrnii-CCMP3373.AAC.1